MPKAYRARRMPIKMRRSTRWTNRKRQKFLKRKNRDSQRRNMRRNRSVNSRRVKAQKHKMSRSKSRLRKRKEKPENEDEDAAVDQSYAIPILDDDDDILFDEVEDIEEYTRSIKEFLYDVLIWTKDKAEDLFDVVSEKLWPDLKDVLLFLLNNLGLCQEYEINDFGQRLSPSTGRPVLLSLGPLRIVQVVEDPQMMRSKWDPYIMEFLKKSGRVSDSWRANRMAMEVYLHMDKDGIMQEKPNENKLL